VVRAEACEVVHRARAHVDVLVACGARAPQRSASGCSSISLVPMVPAHICSSNSSCQTRVASCSALLLAAAPCLRTAAKWAGLRLRLQHMAGILIGPCAPSVRGWPLLAGLDILGVHERGTLRQTPALTAARTTGDGRPSHFQDRFRLHAGLDICVGHGRRGGRAQKTVHMVLITGFGCQTLNLAPCVRAWAAGRARAP